MLKQQLVKVRG